MSSDDINNRIDDNIMIIYMIAMVMITVIFLS